MQYLQDAVNLCNNTALFQPALWLLQLSLMPSARRYISLSCLQHQSIVTFVKRGELHNAGEKNSA